ncbi:DNA (cytosine-5-)-methyltransferase [Rhizobium leguminosarum]|uniref:DNA cytosine methyltransferase n=1 Tax=Rhizobium leguminosarum TaxID=384 RepID=UPI002E0DFD94|nr:DNA (cytosine-5-)-methyltransferase [Rhizobium leguminosarum]WSH77157.1 DNA (cytosine-5-)-methyltransferase [Rhizobium leguminosarum]
MARRTVDLFCGCGGLTTGLVQAGFDVVAGVDGWKDAITVYKANHESEKHDCLVHDLSDVEGTIELVSKYRPFLIAGGPPCQDFSSAGHREEGDRADLTVKYAKVIAGVKPVAFIMENVPRAALSAAFAQAKTILSEAGYGLSFAVLNAAHHGVPQLRKRMFLIGMLGEQDGFLDKSIKAGRSEKPMTVREFLIQQGEQPEFEHYYRHPRSYERRGVYSIDEPSATIRGVNRPKSATYNTHDNDTASGPEVKALSLAQRAHIQTFRKNYFDVSGVSNAAKEQMVGNAVPVNLAYYVAERLRTHIEAKFFEARSDGLTAEVAEQAKNHTAEILALMENTGKPFGGDVATHAQEIFEAFAALQGETVSVPVDEWASRVLEFKARADKATPAETAVGDIEDDYREAAE